MSPTATVGGGARRDRPAGRIPRRVPTPIVPIPGKHEHDAARDRRAAVAGGVMARRRSRDGSGVPRPPSAHRRRSAPASRGRRPVPGVGLRRSGGATRNCQ
jgi:hypothetical protein